MQWPQMSSLTAKFRSKREECCGETWLEATLKKIWQYFILKHGKLEVSNKALLLNPLSV